VTPEATAYETHMKAKHIGMRIKDEYHYIQHKSTLLRDVRNNRIDLGIHTFWGRWGRKVWWAEQVVWTRDTRNTWVWWGKRL